MAQQVNPEAVIARLASQLGQMVAEIAMRDVALEDAEKRIAELEAAAKSEPTSFPAPALAKPSPAA